MKPDRTLSLTIGAVAYANLEKMAKAANTPLAMYAGQLLMAAYSARLKPTTDLDLDAAVARVAILDAVEDTPIEDIAKWVGLSVATVKMILKAWHRDLAGVTEKRS